jgi:hypothetical protein
VSPTALTLSELLDALAAKVDGSDGAARAQVLAHARRAVESAKELLYRDVDELDRAIEALDRRERGSNGQCECWSTTDVCLGELHESWCRECTFVSVRCEAHGGKRGAGGVVANHLQRNHGVARHRAEAAADPGRVQRRSATVPMGQLSLPPAPGRDDRGGAHDRAAENPRGEAEGARCG